MANQPTEVVIDIEPLRRATAIKSEKDDAEMVLVRGGEFWMGSEDSEDEKPRHRVYLDGFYIDKFEVTNALFERFEPEGHEFSHGCFNQRGRCGSYRGPRGVSTRSRARVISSNCWRNAPRMCREL